MSTLVSLPNELIEAIALEIESNCEPVRSLEDDWGSALGMEEDNEPKGDMCPFRLTCRYIQLATRPASLTTYFTSRKLVLDRTRLTDLATIGKMPEFAERVNTIKIICSDIRGVKNVEETAKRVDSRFTTVRHSADCIVVALRNFRNIKRLNFSEYYIDTSEDACGKLADHTETFDAVIMGAELCGFELAAVRRLRFNTKPSDYDVCKFASILRNNQSLSTLKHMDVELEPLSWTDELPELDWVKSGFQLATGLNQLKHIASLRLRIEFSI